MKIEHDFAPWQCWLLLGGSSAVGIMALYGCYQLGRWLA